MDTLTTGASPFRGRDSFTLDVGHGGNQVREHFVAESRDPGASESGHSSCSDSTSYWFIPSAERMQKSDYDSAVRNAVVRAK
jgi:hypothetical protein